MCNNGIPIYKEQSPHASMALDLRKNILNPFLMWSPVSQIQKPSNRNSIPKKPSVYLYRCPDHKETEFF